MKILFSLEHTVAGDILNILRRLPFQPHFLKDFEEQLEKMVAADSPKDPEVVTPTPAVDPAVDPAVAADSVQ